MELSVYNLPGIIGKIFPTSIGILLTGSQQQRTAFLKEKDIDVVVFVYAPGNVIYHLMRLEGYLLDLTLIPLTDIEATLENERYDVKGTLLDKLRNGIVIDDKTGIVRMVQERGRSMYGNTPFDTWQAYRLQVINLRKFLKYFFNKADQYPTAVRQFVLYDWFSTITTVESFRLSGYLMIAFHKHELLSGRSPGFLKEVNEVMEEAITNNNYQPAIDYTLLYADIIRKVDRYKPPKNAVLILDLGFQGFSLPVFVREVLPMLLKHPVVSSAFRYFYASPAKYFKKYQNKVALCFSQDSSGGKYYRLRSTVNWLITNNKTVKDIRLSVAFGEDTDKNGIPGLDNFRRQLSSMYCNWISQAADTDTQPLMHAVLQVVSLLQTSTGIGLPDLTKANGFLIQNAIFGNTGQVIKNDLSIIQKQYDQAMKAASDEYISIWSSFLPSALQNQLFNVPPEFDSLAMLVSSMCQADSSPIHDNERGLFYQACLPLKFDRTDSAFRYMVLAEEAFKMLNIEYCQRVTLLYAYSKAMAAGTIVQTI